MKTTTPEKQEAATTSQQKGWVKWASRIGKFLMYGGWILVAIVGVAIAILISMLTSR